METKGWIRLEEIENFWRWEISKGRNVIFKQYLDNFKKESYFKDWIIIDEPVKKLL